MNTQFKYILKTLAIICCSAVLLLFFISCATTSDSTGMVAPETTIENVSFSQTMEMEAGRLWTFLPEDGNLLFIGYAGNLFDDEEEQYKALIRAAEYASAYKWLHGETGFLDSRKGQFSFTEIDYDMETAVALFKNLEVIELHQDGKGTVLIAKLTGTSAPNYKYNPIPSRYPKGDAPEWTLVPPEFEGYYVAVGADEKKFDLPASFLASDRQALAELLRQVNLKTKAGQAEQVIESVGQIETKVSSQRAEAELRGVYILARYQSLDGKYFYTLAICPRNQ